MAGIAGKVDHNRADEQFVGLCGGCIKSGRREGANEPTVKLQTVRRGDSHIFNAPHRVHWNRDRSSSRRLGR